MTIPHFEIKISIQQIQREVAKQLYLDDYYLQDATGQQNILVYPNEDEMRIRVFCKQTLGEIEMALHSINKNKQPKSYFDENYGKNLTTYIQFQKSAEYTPTENSRLLKSLIRKCVIAGCLTRCYSDSGKDALLQKYTVLWQNYLAELRQTADMYWEESNKRQFYTA